MTVTPNSDFIEPGSFAPKKLPNSLSGARITPDRFPEHLRRTPTVMFVCARLAEHPPAAFVEAHAVFMAWLDWTRSAEYADTLGDWSPNEFYRAMAQMGFQTARRGKERGFRGLRILPVRGAPAYSLTEARESAAAAMLAELIPPMFSYRRLHVFVSGADLFSGFEEHHPRLANGLTQTAFTQLVKRITVPGLRHWMVRRAAGNGFAFQPTRAPKLEDLL